jgi:hypothetical protein
MSPDLAHRVPPPSCSFPAKAAADRRPICQCSDATVLSVCIVALAEGFHTARGYPCRLIWATTEHLGNAAHNADIIASRMFT